MKELGHYRRKTFRIGKSAVEDNAKKIDEKIEAERGVEQGEVGLKASLMGIYRKEYFTFFLG